MATTAIARLALIKALLNEDSADYDDDLKALALAVTDWVQTYCDRTLESVERTEYYTGNGSNKLWLREWPVTAISSVAIWDGDDSYDTESSDYYEEFEDRYIHYPKLGQEGNATWPNWYAGTENNIKVVYTSGYDCSNWVDAAYPDPGAGKTFDAPRDLEYAVAQLVVLAFNGWRKSQGLLGLSSKTLVGETIVIDKYISGIPADVERVLNGYRRLVI